MIKSFFLTLLFALFSVAALAQSAFGMSNALNLESEGAVVSAAWETDEHDFGTIPQDVPATYTFTVVNEGNKPLLIKNVKPSCGCTATDYTKEPIAPGESGYVKASYNAHNPGYFSKTVVVTTNDDENPRLMLRLKGEVQTKKE
jgi:archaellum component FlaG (FlaF/FlaG flagellin family)